MKLHFLVQDLKLFLGRYLNASRSELSSWRREVTGRCLPARYLTSGLQIGSPPAQRGSARSVGRCWMDAAAPQLLCDFMCVAGSYSTALGPKQHPLPTALASCHDRCPLPHAVRALLFSDFTRCMGILIEVFLSFFFFF